MTIRQYLPGMEIIEEDDNEYHEGRPRLNGRYFDAAILPDAPAYQRNALNNQTYILYIVFPTWESLKEGIKILTGGSRNSLASSAKAATISSQSIHKGTKTTLLDMWRSKILQEVVDDDTVFEDFSDEAQEPVQ